MMCEDSHREWWLVLTIGLEWVESLPEGKLLAGHEDWWLAPDDVDDDEVAGGDDDGWDDEERQCYQGHVELQNNIKVKATIVIL